MSRGLNSFWVSTCEALPPVAESSLLALTTFVNDVEFVAMSGFLVAIKPSYEAETSRHVAKVKNSITFQAP